MNTVRKIFLAAILSLNIMPAASAENIPSEPQLNELRIVDSSGELRGLADVSDSGTIEFEVIDSSGSPADGYTVFLKNPTTGAVLEAKSVAGVVSFSDVAPGVWTVMSDGVTFTNVTITSLAVATGGAAAGSALAVSLGGAAVAGGAVAIAESNDNKSSPELSKFK